MQASEYQKVGYHIDIRKKTVKGPRKALGSHYHNACEMHYFLKGNVSFFIRNQVYNIKEGDLLFIDSHEIHNSIDTREEYEKIVMMYRPSFADSNPNFRIPDVFQLLNHKFGGARLVSLPGPLQERIEAIMGEMLSQYNKQGTYSLLHLHANLTLLLTHLAEYLEEASAAHDGKRIRDQRISAIIDFLDANLDGDLSLDLISETFNTNKYHLCKYFKKQTGLSIFDYINRSRIVRAEKLIIRDQLSITDICYKVGFNNLTHFERMFKQFIGMTPRNYRKNLSSNSLS